MTKRALFFSLFMFALPACSDRGPMPRIANTSEGESGIGNGTYRITVRNESNAAKIKVDLTSGAASFYAVNGEIIDATTALQRMKTSDTVLCSTAFENYTMPAGKLILGQATETTTTDPTSNRTIYFTTIADKENTSSVSFSVICGRYAGPLTSALIKKSLNATLDMMAN